MYWFLPPSFGDGLHPFLSSKTLKINFALFGEGSKMVLSAQEKREREGERGLSSAVTGRIKLYQICG